MGMVIQMRDLHGLNEQLPLLSRSHCHREPIAFTAGQAIDEICIRFDYIFFVGTFFVLFYNVLRIFSI